MRRRVGQGSSRRATSAGDQLRGDWELLWTSHDRTSAQWCQLWAANNDDRVIQPVVCYKELFLLVSR